MSGLVADFFTPPNLSQLETSRIGDKLTNDILARWKKEVGHEICLKICGVCGKRGFESVYSSVLFDNLYFNKFKFRPDEKVPDRKLFHVFEHNGDKYKLALEGIEEAGENVYCNLCEECEGITQSSKIPKHSLAFGDWGRRPDLPELSLVEKTCISRFAIFGNIVKLKQIDNCSQNALVGGHMLAISIENGDGITWVTKKFPREDVSNLINVIYMSRGKNFKMVLDFAKKEGPLVADYRKCIQWLKFLKKRHPLYKNVHIPESESEIANDQNILNGQVEQILDAAVISDSGFTNVVELSNTSDISRPSLDIENGSAGFFCNMGHSLLATLPNVAQPDMVIFNAIDKKIHGPIQSTDVS